MSARGTAAERTLRDALPQLTADQAETALSRLREAEYPPDNELVLGLLDRLGEASGVRRRNRAAKWFDAETSARDERRSARQQRGTVEEQREKFADYREQLELTLEAETRGQHLKPASREAGIRLANVLTMTPNGMRKHLSQEALEVLAKIGPPLSFDAWRYANLGARDARAVASWKRRTSGYFSEYG